MASISSLDTWTIS